MIDNSTNTIQSPAPLFDHGNSLCSMIGMDSLESEEKYIDILFPCVYDDFVSEAKKSLTERHKDGLRHLLNFRFKRHSRYNLSSKRLK